MQTRLCWSTDVAQTTIFVEDDSRVCIRESFVLVTTLEVATEDHVIDAEYIKSIISTKGTMKTLSQLKFLLKFWKRH
jgi:hypothetical protein